MFRLLLIFLQFQSIILSQDLDSVFIIANENFNKKNFIESSKNYELILSNGYHSVDLYLNMGNSYFYLEEFGHSRWSFEKGLQLSPFDKDLNYNYEQLIKSVTNAIEPPKNNFLDLFNIFLQSFSLNIFILSAVSVFFIFSLLTLLDRIFKNKAIQKISYIFLSILVLNILLVFTKKVWDENNSYAIVVKDETAIYSAPYLNDSIQMSVLYNGNKVKVDQKTNLWLEITTFDGRKGWIRAKDIRNLD